ncbi:hypothetical protein BDB00DRAFT_804701 [Zychaea mexicana]|uniref:uncharacterized protein n=1 Tax=Zychaea mexicana TaxID=64656 RepID=UPI0022FDC22E|nr:uncharacterized protein BDB00DRAFT_804701 [Zychaea mexicana]KAI9497488.1 hypothetical protein BDB00DRAFT_804701 [Zychaea mexicana]
MALIASLVCLFFSGINLWGANMISYQSTSIVVHFDGKGCVEMCMSEVAFSRQYVAVTYGTNSPITHNTHNDGGNQEMVRL